MKLDRLIAKHHSFGRRKAHQVIAAGRVRVNAVVVTDSQQQVDRFMKVTLEEQIVQQAERALYLMLHKPLGILSATRDAEHRTVLDLIDDPDKHTLHLAGRLDRASSGLLLLTNDGRWSKHLMSAEHKVSKVYVVDTVEPIVRDAVEAFAQGFYFHTENITTLPAKLEILGQCRARVTLHEGRYHQIKRMFHRVGNRVVALHRVSMGAMVLPDDLPAGQWRALTSDEREAALRSFLEE